MIFAVVASVLSPSGELARFALNIRSSRRHLSRRLSSDGQHGRTFVATRSLALLAHCGGLAASTRLFILSFVFFSPTSASLGLLQKQANI
jgi:hypothetical protein